MGGVECKPSCNQLKAIWYMLCLCAGVRLRSAQKLQLVSLCLQRVLMALERPVPGTAIRQLAAGRLVGRLAGR